MAKKSNSSLKILVFFIITTVVVLIGRFDIFSFIRTPISFVYQPVGYVAFNSGRSVASWSNALINASSYISEFEKCKDELVELKSLEDSRLMLLEENESLKKQMSFSNKEDVYAVGRILKYYSDGTVSIDVGSNDGLEVGDVAVFGNIFLGVVVESDLDSSMVKLPTSKASSYEVAIMEGDLDKKINKDTYIKSRAVVTGGVDGIRVENININSDVKDGDLVVVRDERVGMLLILGRVVSLEDNPASTSKSAFVSPAYDYANLITIFVKTQ